MRESECIIRDVIILFSSQVVHTMLPVSVPVSCVGALALSTLHTGFYVGSSYKRSHKITQLIAEIIFLASASVSGLYYRVMSDAAHIGNPLS